MDISGWSLMAVTFGGARCCCCVGWVSSVLGEGPFSAGVGTGSCTVAVGFGAGVAVLLGRLKMSVTVRAMVLSQSEAVWSSREAVLAGGSCCTVEVEDVAGWRRLAGAGLDVFDDRRFLGFFGAKVAKSQVIVTASFVGLDGRLYGRRYSSTDIGYSVRIDKQVYSRNENKMMFRFQELMSKSQ